MVAVVGLAGWNVVTVIDVTSKVETHLHLCLCGSPVGAVSDGGASVTDYDVNCCVHGCGAMLCCTPEGGVVLISDCTADPCDVSEEHS